MLLLLARLQQDRQDGSPNDQCRLRLIARMGDEACRGNLEIALM